MGNCLGRSLNIFLEKVHKRQKHCVFGEFCCCRWEKLGPGLMGDSGRIVRFFGWVYCVFLRCWSRWPSEVMYDLDRFHLTVATYSPRQVAKNPWWMALSQVERTGYPAAACRKATLYCAVFTYMMLIARLAMWGWCMLEAGMCIIHSQFFVGGTLATS